MNSINPYESSVTTVALGDDADEQLAEAADFQPADVSGALTIAALIFNLVLMLISFLIDAQLFGAYTRLVVEDFMDEAWVEVVMNRLGALSRAMWALYWFTATFLIVWMYRAYGNLAALGHTSPNAKRIWVVVCWFVPIMNLISPYQIMREIWWRTEPLLPLTNATAPAPLVVGWWIAFLGMVGASLLSRYFLPDEWITASDVVWSTAGNMVYIAFRAIAAALLMTIIFQVNRRQRARYLALRRQETG